MNLDRFLTVVFTFIQLSSYLYCSYKNETKIRHIQLFIMSICLFTNTCYNICNVSIKNFSKIDNDEKLLIAEKIFWNTLNLIVHLMTFISSIILTIFSKNCIIAILYFNLYAYLVWF